MKKKLFSLLLVLLLFTNAHAAVVLSTAVKNAMLDSIEVTASTSAKLSINTLSSPGDLSATGSVLALITLPPDWMNDASGGTKTLKGSWAVSATGSGTAAHWTLYKNDGTTAVAQGSVSATGAGGDLTLDTTTVTSGTTVTITSFTLTAAN